MSGITISYRLLQAARTTRSRVTARPEHIVRCEAWPPGYRPVASTRALCGVTVLGRGWPSGKGQPYQSGCASCVRAWLEETGTATISVSDIIAGRLPEDAMAVYWRDTGRLECRPHLTAAFPPGEGGRLASKARTGIVLTMARHGAIVCNACEETTRPGAGQETGT